MDAKVIDISIENGNANKFSELMQELQKRISPEDLSLEIDENSLRASLVALDVEAFTASVKELSKRYDIKKSDNPFYNLIDEIESIKSYGLKAGKRLYIGYNRERKVAGRKAKVEKRGMHYYANDNQFSQENTSLPKEYVDKIICADSEELLKKLPDNCIDLVFTSPPYNFGLEYSSTNDDHYWEKYFDKLFAIFAECVRVVKWGGRIAINIQPLFSDYIPSHHIISNFFIKNKMIWKGEILWEKNNYNCKYTAWGSWKSPSNPYMKYTWEFVELFCKGSLKKGGIKGNDDITGDEFKKWVLAKWSIAPERKMKDYGHPAMFPEELVQRVLKLFSFKDDVILDPFNGAGTTTFVAKQLNRHYLGIDVSKEYVDKAKQRIQSVLF
jgi:DNA modification methylase